MKSLFDISKEYILNLESRKYQLIYVEPNGYVDCGGSSIVYKAREYGKKGLVIIKEFYPHNLKIKRKEEDGSIDVYEMQKEEYKKLMARAKSESAKTDAFSFDNGNKDARFFKYEDPVEANNTLYTVIETDKGDILLNMIIDGFFKDKDFTYICDCILMILKELKPIHDEELLHLDISPANIYFSKIGESDLLTDYLVRLIDFNSAYSRSDIAQNEDWVPSIKDGYSAHELVSFKGKEYLNYYTDLYSVAAIFFELLVGRKPEGMDILSPKRWQSILTCESGYLAGATQELIKETSKFFKNNLSITPDDRFKNIEEMRNAIEKLKVLRKEHVIHDNRKEHPPSKHFVGRESKLKEIDNKLQNYSYVILAGMGGTGKTELAKKYAWDNQGKYDKIQFVSFNENLLSTIASIELDNDEKSDVNIFQIKMSALEKCDEKTLIIIDNYDVPDDKNFDKFVSHKYNVIFTSRVTPQDEYKENEIDISSMENKDDLLKLFYAYYNPKLKTEEVKEEEKATVYEIIKHVQGHTMTVMLIALAMKEDEIEPKDMLERLKKGLDTQLTDYPVKKDDEYSYKTMYGHIKTLFDIAKIRTNDNYVFIMTNMAIVPYTGMDKNTFYDWALKERYESNEYNSRNRSDLEVLIRRGWIKENNHAISLHPVISEVANKELKPDSKKCAELIKNMMRFKGYYNVQKICLDLACERICDETLLRARLMNRYARIVLNMDDNNKAQEYNEKALAIIEKISGNKLLLKWRMKIFKIFTKNSNHDYFEITYDCYETICDCYITKGEIYFNEGNYQDAIEWFKQALPFSKSRIFYDINVWCDYYTAWIYDNIGECYSCLGDYKTAIDWRLKAPNIFEKENNLLKTAEVYYITGTDYFNLGMYHEALDFFKKALPCLKFYKPNVVAAAVYEDMSRACLHLNDTQKALEYCKKCHKALSGCEGSLALSEKVTYDLEICANSNRDSEAWEWYYYAIINIIVDSVKFWYAYDIYPLRGSLRLAAEWLPKFSSILEERWGMEHPLIIEICELITEINEILGKKEKSIEYKEEANKNQPEPITQPPSITEGIRTVLYH